MRTNSIRTKSIRGWAYHQLLMFKLKYLKQTTAFESYTMPLQTRLLIDFTPFPNYLNSTIMLNFVKQRVLN